jgi:hypothetical protein
MCLMESGLVAVIYCVSFAASLHPNEIVVAEGSFSLPAIGAEETAFGNAVVQARHVVGQESGHLCREPVMADEHGLGGRRVRCGRFDNGS